MLAPCFSSRSANLTTRGGAQQAFGLEVPRSSPSSCRRRRCSGSKRPGIWRRSVGRRSGQNSAARSLVVGCPPLGQQRGDGKAGAPPPAGTDHMGMVGSAASLLDVFAPPMRVLLEKPLAFSNRTRHTCGLPWAKTCRRQ